MSRYPNRSGTAVRRSSCLSNSHSQGQPDPSQNSSTGFSPNTSPELCEHGSRGGHQCWRELLTLGLLSYNLFLLFCQNLSSAQKPSIKLDYCLLVESIVVACFRHWIKKVIATFYFTILTFFFLPIASLHLGILLIFFHRIARYKFTGVSYKVRIA